MLELFTTDWRELWDGAESTDPVGAIFTRPEIVDLILDLAGYAHSARRLASCRLLEPSCGDGAFLAAVLTRLLASEKRYNGHIWDDSLLDDAIRAADINEPSVISAREMVCNQLVEAGCPLPRATQLAEIWIVHTDFLLTEWPRPFHFVIGNPPYVRIEDLPKRVLLRYRTLFRTTTDRADLYVAFFEKGLRVLAPQGTLAFICANRFAKNRYGVALRRLIAQKYRVRHYLNLEHTQPFLTDVSAYPAIIVLDREAGKPTRAGTLDNIEPVTLSTVRSEALGNGRQSSIVTRFNSWYSQGEPWLTTSSKEHDLLTRLHRDFPVLENSAPGTRVGIGVATGADSVFVLDQKDPDIEEERQIPLLMSADVNNERLNWSGKYLLNPFADADDGTLADLTQYPGFAQYLAQHAERLQRRHCAKARPHSWYRTIDRVWPGLRHQPKLMIPDIQGSTSIGFDEGHYYPHHNLYWITSDSWPLLALKALLRTSLVFQQVRAYSVQMRGGSVRFQAQTLRRLRIPPLSTIPDSLLERLASLAQTDVQCEIDEAGRETFSISA